MYNHAFDVAFAVITEHAADVVTPEEWLAGLKERVKFLEENPDELKECVESCLPFDTYVVEED